MDEIIWMFFSFGSVIGLIGVITFQILWKMMRNKRYPVEVPMLVQRDRGVVWMFGERARYFKQKDGFEGVMLMKAKKPIKPPSYGYLSTNDKGKPVYSLFNTSVGQYFPARVVGNPNDPSKSPVSIEIVEDKGAKNWAFEMLRRADAKYIQKEGFWTKYGPMIMPATFAAMVIFFVIFVMDRFGGISSQLASAASSLSDALTVFSQTPPPANAPVVG